MTFIVYYVDDIYYPTKTLDWVLHGETLGNKAFPKIFQAALAEADRWCRT